MKANELMIGDWVMLDMSYPSSGVKKPVRLTLQDLIYIEQGKDCEPIHLTKEILEKNGFRYEHNYGSFYRSILGDYAKDKEPVVSIGWANGTQMCEWDIADGHRGASYGHNVLHVHQFQQALRICGLNDLADNFKV